MHAASDPRLRKKHGAELARADDADSYRAPSSLAFEQHGVKIHGVLL
jgi:hypothetical protein